jgi:Protease subunit of ATP-dependent Clp proteases
MSLKLTKGKFKKEEENSCFSWATMDEETREVYLLGAVGDEMAAAAIPAIRHLDRTRGTITFIISSTGGDVDVGLSLYDTINLINNKTVGYCYGSCMSIMALVLQSFDKRYLSPNCRFMIHNGTMSVDCGFDEGMALTEEIRRLNDITLDIMAKRATIPLSKVRNMCLKTKFMSASEACLAGFADGILETPRRRK